MAISGSLSTKPFKCIFASFTTFFISFNIFGVTSFDSLRPSAEYPLDLSAICVFNMHRYFITFAHQTNNFNFEYSSYTFIGKISACCTTIPMAAMWKIANLWFFIWFHANMCWTLNAWDAFDSSFAWIAFFEKVCIHLIRNAIEYRLKLQFKTRFKN